MEWYLKMINVTYKQVLIWRKKKNQEVYEAVGYGRMEERNGKKAHYGYIGTTSK